MLQISRDSAVADARKARARIAAEAAARAAAEARVIVLEAAAQQLSGVQLQDDGSNHEIHDRDGGGVAIRSTTIRPPAAASSLLSSAPASGPESGSILAA